MNALELTSVITALANTIAAELDNGKVALLSAIFVQLGDTLATIATVREKSEES